MFCCPLFAIQFAAEHLNIDFFQIIEFYFKNFKRSNKFFISHTTVIFLLLLGWLWLGEISNFNTILGEMIIIAGVM